MKPDIWPLTVSRTRYQGVYEGGDWIAFRFEPWQVPLEPWGDDITCNEFFVQEDAPVYGVGNTPDEAIADLVRRMCFGGLQT